MKTFGWANQRKFISAKFSRLTVSLRVGLEQLSQITPRMELVFCTVTPASVKANSLQLPHPVTGSKCLSDGYEAVAVTGSGVKVSGWMCRVVYCLRLMSCSSQGYHTRALNGGDSGA